MAVEKSLHKHQPLPPLTICSSSSFRFFFFFRSFYPLSMEVKIKVLRKIEEKKSDPQMMNAFLNHRNGGEVILLFIYFFASFFPPPFFFCIVVCRAWQQQAT